MIFNNVSIRWITVFTAMSVVVCFVFFYLMFKFLWSYDRQVMQVHELQQEEVSRVETVINIGRSRMGDSMSDYAAWNDMVSYIKYPNSQFIEDSIGVHAFTSQAIDGIFIFSPDQQLIWGMEFDAETNQNRDIDSFVDYFPVMLREASEFNTNFVRAIVRFIVIGQEPYLASTSRVCNSDGLVCDKGYLIFLKKVRSQFAHTIEQATGVDIEVLTNQDGLEHYLPENNVSYIDNLDYSGNVSVVVKVNHRITLPSFIVWQEVFALLAFSIMFYFINLLLAKSLVKPITDANQVLERFKIHGGTIPDESSFVSKEMKGFARTINQIMSDLEANRQTLRWQSEHDPLTEISNRRHLESRLASFIEDYQFSNLLLYLVDIDFFKLYNDNLSHLDGDNALKAVAKALNDISYSGDKIVARFGGEEFCIVFGSDIELDAKQYAKKLKDAVDNLAIPHPYTPIKGNISISIGGVKVTKPKMTDYQDMFHQADQALYLAKDNGRNQYVVNQFYRKSSCSIGVK